MSGFERHLGWWFLSEMSTDTGDQVRREYFKKSCSKVATNEVGRLRTARWVIRRSRFGNTKTYWAWHYWQKGGVTGEVTTFHNSWSMYTCSNHTQRRKNVSRWYFDSKGSGLKSVSKTQQLNKLPHISWVTITGVGSLKCHIVLSNLAGNKKDLSECYHLAFPSLRSWSVGSFHSSRSRFLLLCRNSRAIIFP